MDKEWPTILLIAIHSIVLTETLNNSEHIETWLWFLNVYCYSLLYYLWNAKYTLQKPTDQKSSANNFHVEIFILNVDKVSLLSGRPPFVFLMPKCPVTLVLVTSPTGGCCVFCSEDSAELWLRLWLRSVGSMWRSRRFSDGFSLSTSDGAKLKLPQS